MAQPEALKPEAPAQRKKVRKKLIGLPQHQELFGKLEEAFRNWSDVAVDFMKEAKAAVDQTSAEGTPVEHGSTILEAKADDQQLRQRLERLEINLEVLGKQLKNERGQKEELRRTLDEAVARMAADGERAKAVGEELEELRQQLQSRADEVARFQKQITEMRRGKIQAIEVERDEARRSLAGKIAETLRRHLDNFRDAEERPASPEQAVFLRTIVRGVVQSLKAEGVPLP